MNNVMCLIAIFNFFIDTGKFCHIEMCR